MSSVWLLLRGDAAVSASKLKAKSLGTCWIKSYTLTRDNVIIVKSTQVDVHNEDTQYPQHT